MTELPGQAVPLAGRRIRDRAMDDKFRDLERQAATGDQEAQEALERLRCRTGQHCACKREDVSELVQSHHVGISSYGYFSSQGSLLIQVRGSDLQEVAEKITKICRTLDIAPPAINGGTNLPCPYCGVKEGQPCVTKFGRRAETHAARQRSGCIVTTQEDLYYDHSF